MIRVTDLEQSNLLKFACTPCKSGNAQVSDVGVFWHSCNLGPLALPRLRHKNTTRNDGQEQWLCNDLFIHCMHTGGLSGTDVISFLFPEDAL